MNSAQQHIKKSKLGAQHHNNRDELRVAVRGHTASQLPGTVRNICVGSNNSSTRTSRRFGHWQSKADQLLQHKLRMAVPVCAAHHAAAREESVTATVHMKTVTTNRLVLLCMAKEEKKPVYSEPRPVKQSFASTRGRML